VRSKFWHIAERGKVSWGGGVIWFLAILSSLGNRSGTVWHYLERYCLDARISLLQDNFFRMLTYLRYSRFFANLDSTASDSDLYSPRCGPIIFSLKINGKLYFFTSRYFLLLLLYSETKTFLN
jgi:hypothetical protein